MSSRTVQRVLAEKGSHVATIEPEASVFEALERMAEHDIGALVVTVDARLVGIVSERDYARKVILAGRASRDTSVRDVMSGEVVTVSTKDTVGSCMQLMTARRIRHLPVVEEGALLGIVSIGDLVKAIIADQAFEIEQLQGYIAGTP
ncbi:MAG: CBS domain-containing protein [Trueperaceae bacterium]|nr:CBS domain-containing protein [Trueperaceae bacterium]